MKNSHKLTNYIGRTILMTINVLVLIPMVCHAQWYQGPSGGRGGEAFDSWTASNQNTEIAGIGLLEDNAAFDFDPKDRLDNVILCISIRYKNGHSYKYGGHCDEKEPRWGTFGWEFRGEWNGFQLQPGEHLIGVAGRFGDSIDSLRFYTTKLSYSFGDNGGTTDFGYSAPTGQRIVGLFGRTGTRIDAIGVLFAPIPIIKAPAMRRSNN